MSKPWFKKYKLTSDNNAINQKQNMIFDGVDSNIPINMPSFIVGSKNAGKSTFISGIIHAATDNDLFTNIIYISPDNVDTTLSEVCHVPIIRVPNILAEQFLITYLRVKSNFLSWGKFLKYNKFEINSLSQMLKAYTDQNIDNYLRSLGTVSETTPENMYNHAVAVINKYAVPFSITVDGTQFKFPGLTLWSRDLILMDDLANNKIFPNNKATCKLYGFITACRHYNLCFIFSGQDILQLPRYMRKEVDTWLFGNGVNIKDINSTNCNIPQGKITEIIEKLDDLPKYWFVVYNGINNVVDVIETT